MKRRKLLAGALAVATLGWLTPAQAQDKVTLRPVIEREHGEALQKEAPRLARLLASVNDPTELVSQLAGDLAETVADRHSR